MSVLVSTCLVLGCCTASASQLGEDAVLDDTFVVWLKGVAVDVEPDGGFLISNVLSPDILPQAVIGGPPCCDFIGDEFVQLVGYSAERQMYVSSPPFRVSAMGTSFLGDLVLSPSAPQVPVALQLSVSGAGLLEFEGDALSIDVVGLLADGLMTVQLGSPSDGTTFVSSNPEVASVSEIGLVTANSPGVASITVQNLGLTSVLSVPVTFSGQVTTVSGFAFLPGGNAAVGAAVSFPSLPLLPVPVGPLGDFVFPDVPVDLGVLPLTLELEQGGESYSGAALLLEPLAGGVSDVGIIQMGQGFGAAVFVWSPGGGAGGAGVSSLVAKMEQLGLLVDSGSILPPSLLGYSVVWHHDTFEPIPEDDFATLVQFVELGGGLHLTGERPCCEVLNGSVESVLDALPGLAGVSVGGGGDSLSPYVVNQAAEGAAGIFPTVLQSWMGNGVGVLGGVSGENVFASGTDGLVVGAVWDCVSSLGASGRVSLLMDSNWVSGAGDQDVLENLVVFLAGVGPCE